MGKVCSLEEAEALIADGAADLVAMGRELIADPELPKKELSGRFSEVIRCIHCNSCFQKILSQSPAIACKLHSDN